jgi:hypothetical protein
MAVVTGTSQANIGFNQAISTGVVSAQTLQAGLTFSTAYTNGTGAGAIDCIYAKQLTLAGSATTLDLQALVDLAGTSQVLLRVREIIVQVVTTTVDFDVTLGNAASNSWAPIWGATGTHVVKAGGRFQNADPNTVGSGKGYVVSGTSKSLKLDPGANTVVVNVIIAGCTAVS